MDRQIANRFYEYRKKSGFSQEELAAKLGISRQSVSKWERGEASPDTENLIRLARLYGISLDDLINGAQTDPVAGGEPVQEAAAGPAAQTTAADEAADGVPAGPTDGGAGAEDVAYVGRDEVELIGQPRQKPKKKRHGEFPVAIVALILFLYLGFVFGRWHPGWMVFLLIPLYEGVKDAVRKRRFTAFPFPVLVTAVFFFVGFFFHSWHPAWLLFLLVPVYYPIASWLDREIRGE